MLNQSLPHTFASLALATTIATGACQTASLESGTRITIQARATESVPEIAPEILEATQRVLEKRLHNLGIRRASVEIKEPDRLWVELPSSVEPTQAARVLSSTARLSFQTQQPGTEGELETLLRLRSNLVSSDRALFAANTPSNPELAETNAAIVTLFEPSDLTGEQIVDAIASPSSYGGGDLWGVEIEFNETGAEKFTELTQQMAGTGLSIGIFYDEQLLTAPLVHESYAKTGITGGKASITGNFTMETAEELEIQLKSGVLPVPIELIAIEKFGDTAK